VRCLSQCLGLLFLSSAVSVPSAWSSATRFENTTMYLVQPRVPWIAVLSYYWLLTGLNMQVWNGCLVCTCPGLYFLSLLIGATKDPHVLVPTFHSLFPTHPVSAGKQAKLRVQHTAFLFTFFLFQLKLQLLTSEYFSAVLIASRYFSPSFFSYSTKYIVLQSALCRFLLCTFQVGLQTPASRKAS
jgi:hypothetical protein